MECEKCGLDNETEARFCADCGTALVTTSKARIVAEPTTHLEPVITVEYIGFWSRFIAALIDMILVWILSWALSFVISLLPEIYLFLYWLLNSFVVLLLYFWLFTGLKGQTLGKMIVGIKVVDERGNKPGLLSAAIREILGKILSTIIFFMGFFWIGWDSKKQGLHDKLATTFVVKV